MTQMVFWCKVGSNRTILTLGHEYSTQTKIFNGFTRTIFRKINKLLMKTECGNFRIFLSVIRILREINLENLEGPKLPFLPF